MVGETCSGCNTKLTEADPYFAIVFAAIKKSFPDCHISWSFRNEADQNFAYQHNQSRAKFPSSKHNRTMNGVPCSAAIDLFCLRDGVYYAGKEYFSAINDFLMTNNFNIQWGGLWPVSLGLADYDHYELKP